MNHPLNFFERNPENAVINLDNPYITTGHIMCASKELPLRIEDRVYFTKGLVDAVNELSIEGYLEKRGEGWRYAGPERPTTRVKLNNISDETVKVMYYNQVLETMDLTKAYREVHEGAILLHRGEPYRVKELDLDNLVAHVVEGETNLYTEALKTIDISIRKPLSSNDLGVQSGYGEVNVTEYFNEYRVMQYEKKIDQRVLDLPPLNFPSTGFWFTIPEYIASRVRAKNLNFAGGLHAVEHAIIAVSPLHAMCDPNDLGGVSTVKHGDTKMPSVFVYDGYKGGVGLSEKLYELLPELLETTLNLIQDCQCSDGCPSCIYSSKCGNNNEPLDKQAAIILLEELLAKIRKS
jgi:DEAD/DEAH box helicase domain-containing protein